MLKELKLPGTDAAGVVGWGWSTVLIRYYLANISFLTSIKIQKDFHN